jgi:hypothetical protein
MMADPQPDALPPRQVRVPMPAAPLAYARTVVSEVEDDRARARAIKGLVLARHISLPSLLSTKRSRVITLAAAGTVTLATAISAAVMVPSTSSALSASAADAYISPISQPAPVATQAAQPAAADGLQQSLLVNRARAIQSEHQHEREVAAARAAAARNAAAEAAALKAAEQATAARQAAQAQAAAQATQQAQPAQQAAVTTPAGSPEQIAEQMLSQFGWSSSQFSCLQPLWAQESGWSVTAENPSSGAYGIPQALPGSKMASAGPSWQTDAATQIRWGLTYIQGSYGSPCGAWAHEEADGWY